MVRSTQLGLSQAHSESLKPAPQSVLRLFSVALMLAPTLAGCGAKVNDIPESNVVPASPEPGAELPAKDDATAVAGSSCSAPGTAAETSAILWRGFHHEWERQLASFETPHRLSLFRNYVDDSVHERTPTAWSGSGTAHFGFSAGVDGDYAHPVLRAGGFSSPDVRVHRGKVDIAFSDAVKGDPPEAESSKTASFEVPLMNCDETETEFAAVLGGVDFAADCDDAHQPEGQECNSDGIWPYRMYIAIEACARDATKLRCNVRFDLDRGWTPAKGGGKPLNAVQDYTVGVHYLVVQGPNDRFAATVGTTASESGRIWDGTVVGASQIQGRSGFPLATAGLSAFGFELLETDGNTRRGRYMSYWNTGLEQESYEPITGTLSVNHELGYKAPFTTVASDARYWVQPVMLQFASDAIVSKPRHEDGAVCYETLPFFPCSTVGLQASVFDEVPFVIDGLIDE